MLLHLLNFHVSRFTSLRSMNAAWIASAIIWMKEIAVGVFFFHHKELSKNGLNQSVCFEHYPMQEWEHYINYYRFSIGFMFPLSILAVRFTTNVFSDICFIVKDFDVIFIDFSHWLEITSVWKIGDRTMAIWFIWTSLLIKLLWKDSMSYGGFIKIQYIADVTKLVCWRYDPFLLLFLLQYAVPDTLHTIVIMKPLTTIFSACCGCTRSGRSPNADTVVTTTILHRSAFSWFSAAHDWQKSEFAAVYRIHWIHSHQWKSVNNWS